MSSSNQQEIITTDLVPAPVSAVQVMKDREIMAHQSQFVRTRQQRGHSVMLHVLFGWVLMYIPALYITFSKDHYWRP